MITLADEDYRRQAFLAMYCYGICLLCIILE